MHQLVDGVQQLRHLEGLGHQAVGAGGGSRFDDGSRERDYIFVPTDRAREAVEVLERLAAE